MKKALTIIPWFLVLALLAYIGSCTHTVKDKPEIQYRDTTYTDTVVTIIDNTKHYAKPNPDTVLYPDYIYLYPDSAECHRIAVEYYKNKIYNRHIVIDSIGWIDLRDSVFMNELNGFAVNSRFKQKTVIQYTERTIYPPAKNKLLVGLILTGNKEYFGAIPSIMFQGKKNNCIQVGYDVVNGNYQIGYLMKLGKN